ncbi:GNAT family N-acetyltransferase [Eubacteriaceae bacterium ES3]|nr:GNAT family N-acetyltransferase [Eubacteriaceae bacterium ES3]
MDFLFKNGHDMPRDVFQQLLELDKITYGDQVISEDGLAYRRFEKFKDGIIAAFYKNELAGFICFYSVKGSVYNEAVNEQMIFDDNLLVADLKPLYKNDSNYILLLDMNISKPFRNKGIAKQLIQAVGAYLIQKEKVGCRIDKIFAYAYTEKGFIILENLGGSPVWDKEGIFLMDVDPKTFMELSQ